MQGRHRSHLAVRRRSVLGLGRVARVRLTPKTRRGCAAPQTVAMCQFLAAVASVTLLAEMHPAQAGGAYGFDGAPCFFRHPNHGGDLRCCRCGEHGSHVLRVPCFQRPSAYKGGQGRECHDTNTDAGAVAPAQRSFDNPPRGCAVAPDELRGHRPHRGRGCVTDAGESGGRARFSRCARHAADHRLRVGSAA